MNVVPKKLQKIGGSLGFVVPKYILEKMGWDRNTKLKFYTDGEKLVVRTHVQYFGLTETKAERE